MLGRVGKAALFLVGSGFVAGFVLSSGSAHFFARQTFAAATRAGEQASPPQVAAQQGGKGGQHGGMAEEGNGEGRDGAAESAAGGTAHAAQNAQKHRDGTGTDSVAAAEPAGDTVADQPADILSGNTLQGTGPDGRTQVRYLSRRGWQAEQDRSSLVVRRWMTRDRQFCIVVADDGVACEAIAITRERKPETGTGALLGSATFADGRRWNVLRGNAAGLPETIPLIGGEQPPRPGPLPRKPSATGQSAVVAMIGVTLLPPGDTPGPTGDRFEPDGRWINARPLQPGARTGTGGVRVALGRWLFTEGQFCLDQPGLDLKRTCYRPEQWGKATFRLTSQHPTAVSTLVSVAAL